MWLGLVREKDRQFEYSKYEIPSVFTWDAGIISSQAKKKRNKLITYWPDEFIAFQNRRISIHEHVYKWNVFLFLCVARFKMKSVGEWKAFTIRIQRFHYFSIHWIPNALIFSIHTTMKRRSIKCHSKWKEKL